MKAFVYVFLGLRRDGWIAIVDALANAAGYKY